MVLPSSFVKFFDSVLTLLVTFKVSRTDGLCTREGFGTLEVRRTFTEEESRKKKIQSS